MAWLNSSPTTGDDRVSRYESLIAKQEGEVEMPPLEGFEPMMVKYLTEVGPVSSNGMGITHVSFQEIWCWSKLVGIPLSAFQAELLHKMSKAYAGEYSKSNGDKGAHAPFVPDADTQEQKDALEAGLKDLFKCMSRSPYSDIENEEIN